MNSAHGFSEGSDPIKLTDEERTISTKAMFQVAMEAEQEVTALKKELKQRDETIKQLNEYKIQAYEQLIELKRKDEEIQQLKEALRGFKDVLTTLQSKEAEYKECAVEGNINWEYFKGKADAYEFAVKQLKRIFEWYGIE